MPGFDGTGPMGMGPLTGGGRGYCRPAGAWTGARRPYGTRWGYGFPQRTLGQQFTTREQEIAFLKNQTQELHRILDDINTRISAISGEAK